MVSTVELRDGRPIGQQSSARSCDRVLVAEQHDGRDRLTLGIERNRAAGFGGHLVKPVSPSRAPDAAAAARSVTRRGSQRRPMFARETRAPRLCAKCRKEIPL